MVIVFGVNSRYTTLTEKMYVGFLFHLEKHMAGCCDIGKISDVDIEKNIDYIIEVVTFKLFDLTSLRDS